jgi:ABC-type glycerol-3-phosphate transport system substrate-binding protein
MYTTARLTAVALTAAALAAAGCGADDPAPTASKAKPTTMPIQRYVAEVGGLGQSIDDARSDYFHAEHTRAAVKRGTADVQAAYADAVSRLADIDPPAVAADLHRQLGAAWRKRASQLEKVVASKPFDLPRVDDIMTQTGRDVSTAELYVLPQ